MKRPDKKILVRGLAGLAAVVGVLVLWLLIVGPPPPPPSVTMPVEVEAADEAESGPAAGIADAGPAVPPGLPSPVDTSAKLPLPAVKSDLPSIAIVLSELGPSPALVETIFQKLPPAVSLAFLPFAAESGTMAQAAQKAGHEVLIDVPMEPVTYPDEDPGPDALMTSASAEENDKRLAWDLGRFPNGYVGLVNYMGSRFTTQEDSMKAVLAATKAGKLFYIDTHANPLSVAPLLARAMGVPFAVAGLSLESETSRETFDQDLAKLEEDAHRDGSVLAVIAPSPMAIDRLALWAKSLAAKGLALVPASQVVKVTP